MAIWMQAGNVSWNDLSEEQIEILDGLASVDWVEVTDGDWSLQRDIDLDDVISSKELFRRIECGETAGYVCVKDRLREWDGDWLAALVAAADESWSRGSAETILQFEIRRQPVA